MQRLSGSKTGAPRVNRLSRRVIEASKVNQIAEAGARTGKGS